MNHFQKAVNKAVELSGVTVCALVDLQSGSRLVTAFAQDSPDTIGQSNLAHQCATHAQMLQAQVRLMQDNAAIDAIEDIIFVQDNHYQIVRLVYAEGMKKTLFLYLVAERATCNLVMARRLLTGIAQTLIETADYNLSGTDYALSKDIDFSRLDRMTDTEDEEELPAFMREDSVLKLLGDIPPGKGPLG